MMRGLLKVTRLPNGSLKPDVGRNLTRWLIPLPAILFAVFPQTANAEPVAGLNAVGYTVSAIPPTKSDNIYPVCHSELENNINRNFNGEPFGACPVDMFMVHYTGFIQIPANNTIKFMVAADDGGTIQIGDTEFGTWDDKGCSWSEQTTAEFPAGTYSLDGWLYEDGGYTCFMLAWNINNAGWEIVPDSAFTTTGAPTTTTSTTTTTTTTTTSTTTTTTTTTTLPETTTTTSSTTTLPPTTTTTTSTTVPQTTTSTTTTSTTTTTTTEVPYTPPQTSTTSTTTTVPEPVTTTTTSLPETSTTLQETTTTEPETTSTTYPDGPLEDIVEPDETTIPETTVPEIFDESVVVDTTQPQEEEMLLEDTPDTTVLEEVSSSDIISDEQFEEILDNLKDASPEQVAIIIESILAADITSEQATELVSNVAVLQVISEEDAEQLFSKVVPADLTEEQAALIVEAVQTAPIEVRQAFEGVIDIFGSQFENYVPTGSNIPVSTRRTLVAIGATLTMLPTSRVRR